jgi:hypothetical protein
VVLRLDELRVADEEVTLAVSADEAATVVLAAPLAPLAPPDPESAADAPPAPAAPARGSRRHLGRLAVVLVLLVVVAFAGVLTVSTVFYVGVDDGRLAIYSGLPAALGPLQLHAVYRRSSLPYESLGPAGRRLVDEQGLHTRSSVMALAETLGMWP